MQCPDREGQGAALFIIFNMPYGLAVLSCNKESVYTGCGILLRATVSALENFCLLGTVRVQS